MIDLDDEALAAAARQLGTTEKETVDRALADVVDRRRRLDDVLADVSALGVGRDVDDGEAMGGARR